MEWEPMMVANSAVMSAAASVVDLAASMVAMKVEMKDETLAV